MKEIVLTACVCYVFGFLIGFVGGFIFGYPRKDKK